MRGGELRPRGGEGDGGGVLGRGREWEGRVSFVTLNLCLFTYMR